MAEFGYEDVVAFASENVDVVGLVLAGSRGRGVAVDERSDWDVLVVVDEADAARRVREAFPSRHGSPVEVLVETFEGLRAAGEVGGGEEWRRYSFAHLTPVVDRSDGELQRVLDEKERLPDEVRDRRVEQALDAFVNAAYRALRYESRLDAVEAVPLFLTAAFALDGRVRPYNKYLEWELRHHPLPGWPCDETMALVDAALAGDPRVLRTLFRRLEAQARERGFGHVVDGWQPDVGWLRGDAPYRQLP
jgi:predicted nucleotidyltransferase